MAEMRINAMIAGVSVTPKKDFKTKQPVIDPNNGQPVFNRKLMLVDLDSEEAAIVKVNFSPEQHTDLEALKHKNVKMICDMRFWNGNAYFDLREMKAA